MSWKVTRDDLYRRSGQPARALGSARADLENWATRHTGSAGEQLELRLGPAFGAPDEVGVTKEGAVLGVVLVGLRVPPGTLGANGRPLVHGLTRHRNVFLHWAPSKSVHGVSQGCTSVARASRDALTRASRER